MPPAVIVIVESTELGLRFFKQAAAALGSSVRGDDLDVELEEVQLSSSTGQTQAIV